MFVHKRLRWKYQLSEKERTQELLFELLTKRMGRNPIHVSAYRFNAYTSPSTWNSEVLKMPDVCVHVFEYPMVAQAAAHSYICTQVDFRITQPTKFPAGHVWRRHYPSPGLTQRIKPSANNRHLNYRGIFTRSLSRRKLVWSFRVICLFLP